MQVSITRNYGRTAEEKSNELLCHMGIAVVGVSLLILLTLGWRESVIVGIAIPCTLALTLLVFYLYGYTLNRITLFALIFSIGILVDDAIVVVENIVRHFHLPQNKGRRLVGHCRRGRQRSRQPDHPRHLRRDRGGAADGLCRRVDGALHAADPHRVERRDVLVAGHRLHRHALGGHSDSALGPEVFPADRRHRRREASTGQPHSHFEHEEDFFTRFYRRIMGPLIAKTRWRLAFLVGIVVLLLAAMATVGLGWVKVKMLPFDNKSEFQIILNMPEGSALERTAQAAREIAAAVRVEPEVTDYQIYAGVAAPFNFNGLVRHYFMRRGPHVADLQINLVPKDERKAQSHDIAKRVRPRVAAIAAKYGARVAVAEVPPGPPVLQTLVAEIYGPNERAAWRWPTRSLTSSTTPQGVVDTDWYIEADQTKVRFIVDKEKAALNGISEESIAQTLQMAVGGSAVDLLHLPREKEDVQIVVRLPQSLAHVARRPAGPARPRRQSGQPAGALARAGHARSRRWWTRASTTRT